MITGEEVNPDLLMTIKSKTEAKIYFDVHTLSRKTEEGGRKKFGVIPEFENWAKCIDIIQVNEFEMLSLFGINDELKVADKLFNIGVNILIITKAAKGAIMFYRKDGEINIYFKSAIEIKNVNTIGCGDYFGSAFFYKYLITKNEIISLNFAVGEVEKSLKSRLLCI
jgi:sugar/nucleoside kinase (ribokinase family)